MLANLRALLGVIVDIILLRRGPEHVPASPALLVAVTGVYAIGSALAANTFGPPESRWALELGIAIGATLLWYGVALRTAGKPERFTQTMTALFAVRAIFSPLLIPMVSTIMAQAKAEPPAPPSALGIVVLAVMVWVFVINVRIVRSALEWPTAGAVLLVIAQELATFALFVMLFGLTAAPQT